MIYDSLENFKIYQGLHPQFRDVRKFIERNKLADLPEGRHNINEEGAHAVLSSYLTKDQSEKHIEAHRRFIDIQIILNGMEKVGVCNRADCSESDYDSERDFQQLNGQVETLTLKPNYFAIFMPQDGHMPQIKYGEKPEEVKKLVIKVPV